MKKITLILLLSLFISSTFAQEDKTVVLTVSGQSKSKDEAKQNALRNAIEQAFGTFISSKTEIVNDELIKDEIISVSNGNIQKYDVISQIEMPNKEWLVTLKAVVSISKLTSFCENKGIAVEFKGSLFASNIKQQMINEQNEFKAIEDVCQVIRNIADVSFDYSLNVSDPIAINSGNSQWRIPMKISVSKNKNFDKIPSLLYSTLKGLSLSEDEAKNYIELGKNIYPITIAANEKEYDYFVLRQNESIIELLRMLYYFNHSLQNFKINNGVSEWAMKDYPGNIKHIYDYGFRVFLFKAWRVSRSSEFYRKASVFYTSERPRCDIGSEVERAKGVSLYDCNFVTGKNPVVDYEAWYVKTRIIIESIFIGETGINNTDKYLSTYVNGLVERKSNQKSLTMGDLMNVPKNKRREFLEAQASPYDTSILTDQFKFVNQLSDKFLNNKSGLVMSFISNSDKDIVIFHYEDVRSLDELMKITEYKIVPLGSK